MFTTVDNAVVAPKVGAPGCAHNVLVVAAPGLTPPHAAGLVKVTVTDKFVFGVKPVRIFGEVVFAVAPDPAPVHEML